MSALVTRLQPFSGEHYRASLETDTNYITVYVNDEAEFWLKLSGTRRNSLALMSREEAAALRDMLTEALEAQGVTA